MKNQNIKILNRYISEYRYNLSKKVLCSIMWHESAHQLYSAISSLEFITRFKNKIDSSEIDLYLSDTKYHLSSLQKNFFSIAELICPKSYSNIEKIKESLEKVINIMQELGNRSGVKLIVDSKVENITWNANHFSILLYALIINAIESYKNNEIYKTKVVNIIIRCSKLECIIKIKDYGEGIKPNLQKKIFEQNFTTKPHSEGMGLYIVKMLIDMYGGNINLNIIPNNSTEFIVTIPYDSLLQPQI